MKFQPFEKNREHIYGQYQRIIELTDLSKTQALYGELKDIYFQAPSRILGKARAIKYFLQNTSVFINPYDIFADMCDCTLSPLVIRKEEYTRLHIKSEEAKTLTEKKAIVADADFGHTMPDWKHLLDKGFSGILKEANDLFQSDMLTAEQRDFYQAVILVYEGMIEFTRRLYTEACSILSDNTHFVSENLKALVFGAPSCLGEAMQLYFLYYRVQQFVEGARVRSLGAIDELLYPFYVSDIQSGKYSVEEVRTMFRYFFMKWNSMKIDANIPFDLSVEGNDLTYIILEEYCDMDIHDPKIHVKCAENTPLPMLEIIMKSIRKGNNSFVFINDRAVRRSLEYIGELPEDAKNYTLIGCYEPAAAGKELPCTLNGRISLPMAVEFVLGGGKELGENIICEEYPDFEAFFDQVKKTLKYFADVAIAEINSAENKYPQIVQAPLLSGTFKSCMKQGRDIYSGGAVYNNSSIAVFGIATFIDELMAIKKCVYQEKMITLKNFVQILRNNWQGEDMLRKYVLASCPKYGTNSPEADMLSCETVEFLSECINNRANGRGGVYRLGVFSIDWTREFGAALAASADGRLRGEPISKNLSASAGMNTKGITGVIHSVIKQDHTRIPNGTVLDLMIHPSAVLGEEGIDIMISILRIFLEGGGFGLQMNVLSSDTLIAARREPEKYKNLQVRLCGWNVYFTELSTSAQDEMIRGMSDK